MPPVSNPTHRFVTLDGLRGIAALCVAFRHLPLRPQDGAAHPLFSESYLAVDFFFVLSGFVMAHAYQGRLSAGMPVWLFLKARLARLYPLYLLAFILAIPLSLARFAHGGIPLSTLWKDLVFGAVMLPSPTGGALFPTNVPAWSLLFELVANMIFGLISRWLKASALIWITVAAAFTLTVTVSCGWIGFDGGDGPMNGGAEWRSIGAGFVRVMYSFFAGVLVHRSWRFRSFGGTVSPFIMALALAAVLSMSPWTVYSIPFDLIAALVIFPIIIVISASSVPEKRTSVIFRWLGGASYAIYILQGPFYGYALHAIPFILGDRELGFSLFVGLLVLGCFVVIAKAAEVYADRSVRRILGLQRNGASSVGPRS